MLCVTAISSLPSSECLVLMDETLVVQTGSRAYSLGIARTPGATSPQLRHRPRGMKKAYLGFSFQFTPARVLAYDGGAFCKTLHIDLIHMISSGSWDSVLLCNLITYIISRTASSLTYWIPLSMVAHLPGLDTKSPLKGSFPRS